MSAVSLARTRWAVGSAFFLHGLCFSSWASRIPAIQKQLALSDAELGSLLFAIPLGSIVTSIVSPRLIEVLGIRRTLGFALTLYSALFIGVGLASSGLQLGLYLFVIGCLSNLVNVAVNTQAVGFERLAKRAVMASFHGLWSLAGFAGAMLGTVMMAFEVPPYQHFALVLVLVAGGLAANLGAMLPGAPPGGGRQPMLLKPPASLVGLGLIAFCSMICEGAMFDWSGVYFQNVLHAEPAWIGLGYGSFMSAMATTRFFADRLLGAYGIRRVLTACGSLITAGLLLAIVQPSIVTGVLGFLLVGAGTSAVVPLVISQAGQSEELSPSAAIAATSTIGFVGFLVGPPLIGWLAGLSSLRLSFVVVAMMGLGIVVLARKRFPAADTAMSGRTRSPDFP